MNISIRLSQEDSELIKSFAKLHGVTVSELIRQSVMGGIEDEIDLEAYNHAVKEYQADPRTYTLDEVKKELGLK